MHCKKPKKRLAGFKSCIVGYLRTSNLHGFRNIAPENGTWQESCFWIVICTCGTLMTIIMFAKVWERFQKSPTMTTIETNNYPVKKVPFPAVTICNLNKILKSSFYEIAKKFEEHGVERSKLRKFLKVIPQIYSTRLSKFENEDIIIEVMEKLGYTLESFLFDLSQPCSEYLIRCLWLGMEYNCSTMFDEVKTPEGFCCSFNFHGSKVRKYENTTIRDIWPSDSTRWDDGKRLYVNQASTPLSGLTVVVDVDEDNYFSSVNSFFGSQVILHDSFEYPDVDSPRASVQSRAEATIRLRANIIESSGNVRSLKIYQRQCYFSDEVSHSDTATSMGKEQKPVSFQSGTVKKGGYSYEACTLDCKLYTFVENCHCIPFYYPNIFNSSVCSLNDMKCIRDFTVLASQDTGTATEEWTATWDGHCKCLPSCNDLNYEWVMQSNGIRHEEYASPIFEGKLGNKSAISVFFEQNVCIKYRIESQVTWDSVIASFGGIFGLCLGGSTISLIELLYYFFRQLTKIDCGKPKSIKLKKNIIESPKFYRKKVFEGKPHIFHLNNSLDKNEMYAWVK